MSFEIVETGAPTHGDAPNVTSVGPNDLTEFKHRRATNKDKERDRETAREREKEEER